MRAIFSPITAVTGEQHYSMVIAWSDYEHVYIVSLPE
jgi:hypothetical protein